MNEHPPEWLHPPDLKRATAIQRAIADAVELADRIGPVVRVAGADTSMKWRDSRGPIHAAIACDDGTVGQATRIPPFPYVPGYLGFRECPALVAAWETLVVKPDLVLMDGQGRSHPRRCGVACQLGVLLDVPVIGVAKSLLCGVVDGVLGADAGSTAPLVDRGEVVAMAVRLRAQAAPVYVSIGHRVTLDTAVDWVRRLSDGRRVPPPVRGAHEAANAVRIAHGLAMEAENVDIL
ncbi:endonuclease V [Sphingomonas montana]|uniref:endonuclease V n=1 Tax=Sphingomonas montana TaxID=1843236 RepID=UPI00096E1517|nr:endonuclease V [Sphingomonas montana]